MSIAARRWAIACILLPETDTRPAGRDVEVPPLRYLDACRDLRSMFMWYVRVRDIPSPVVLSPTVGCGIGAVLPPHHIVCAKDLPGARAIPVPPVRPSRPSGVQAGAYFGLPAVLKPPACYDGKGHTRSPAERAESAYSCGPGSDPVGRCRFEREVSAVAARGLDGLCRFGAQKSIVLTSWMFIAPATCRPISLTKPARLRETEA